MKKIEEAVRELLAMGTPQCGLFLGLSGIILAFFLLFLGVWKTLFIGALFSLGLFLGGVKDKPGFVKHWINRIFPPRQDG